MSIMDSIFGIVCSRCGVKRTYNSSGVCDECEEEMDLEQELNRCKKKEMYCPNDGEPMRAKIITVASNVKIVVYRCELCGGIFLPEDKFRKVCSDARSSELCNLLLKQQSISTV